jgi:hypothetical protein
MDEAKAFSIVSVLADGINPLTGEVFPDHSPYQSPEIVRALFVARAALEGKRRNRPRDTLPANAGKPWTEEEDRKLLAQFDRGLAIAELALAHARTVAGIQARLEKHGRLSLSADRGLRLPRRDPSPAQQGSANSS